MTNTMNLPPRLLADGLFCTWRYDMRPDGTQTKVPYSPTTGHRARANDPATFTTLFMADMMQGQYEGLGVGIFNGVCAVDIDNCIVNTALSDTKLKQNITESITATENSHAQTIYTPEALAIMELMDCYTELSPSGKGLRLLFLAPNFDYDVNTYYIKNSRANLEVYVNGVTKRFVTVTGNVVRGGDLEDRSVQLRVLLDSYMKRPEPIATPESNLLLGEIASILSDDEVLAHAMQSKQGAKFSALWAGDFSGQYGSQSEAVAALLAMLAFWCRRDGTQMDRLFRRSGLIYADGKWNRPQSGSTWGAIEIQRALSRCTEVYNPISRGSAIEDFRPFLKVADMTTFKPTDFTDVGASRVLAKFTKDLLRFVGALGWLVWNGQRWEPNDYKAQHIAAVLTDCFVAEAKEELLAARAELTRAEASQDEGLMDKAKAQQEQAKEYLKFAHKQRGEARLNAMLNLSKPSLILPLDDIDANPFILNTPDGIVNLRTGEISVHDPAAMCSKITAVGLTTGRGEAESANARSDEWTKFLKVVTCDDADMATFLQQVAGMAAVGRVFMENLIVAYGAGKNGKSTLFNALQMALGDYAGSLAPEILTADKSNNGASMAELKGRRLVIAAELEEGRRLSASVLKRVASTDKVEAERKYKAPESFTPSHSIVLFTNHMPRPGSMDMGTRRRITVVHFKATIEGKSEIKNYAQYLIEHCGSEILQWVVDGAITFCANRHTLVVPETVVDETEQYFAAHDWMSLFIEECCETGPGMSNPSGGLYEVYRGWAKSRGDYARSTTDFKAELDKRGFYSCRNTGGNVWYGLRLIPQTWQVQNDFRIQK